MRKKVPNRSPWTFGRSENPRRTNAMTEEKLLYAVWSPGSICNIYIYTQHTHTYKINVKSSISLSCSLPSDKMCALHFHFLFFFFYISNYSFMEKNKKKHCQIKWIHFITSKYYILKKRKKFWTNMLIEKIHFVLLFTFLWSIVNLQYYISFRYIT